MTITNELQSVADNLPEKASWKTMAVRHENHRQIKDMADYYKIPIAQVLSIIIKKSYTDFVMEESEKIKERKANDK
jgi:hypothetical protein|tara:strand:- start:16 stop:243 length:228 start_codon:yes stop_codon:yes gene_type:complete